MRSDTGRVRGMSHDDYHIYGPNGQILADHAVDVDDSIYIERIEGVWSTHGLRLLGDYLLGMNMFRSFKRYLDGEAPNESDS